MSRNGDVLLLEGMNLQVVNGEGETDTTNGLENLIVGDNEVLFNEDRSGSHNLVVGPRAFIQQLRWFVAGGNSITGPAASVTGGSTDAASGDLSSILGGNSNTASGFQECIPTGC